MTKWTPAGRRHHQCVWRKPPNRGPVQPSMWRPKLAVVSIKPIRATFPNAPRILFLGSEWNQRGTTTPSVYSEITENFKLWLPDFLPPVEYPWAYTSLPIIHTAPSPLARRFATNTHKLHIQIRQDWTRRVDIAPRISVRPYQVYQRISKSLCVIKGEQSVTPWFQSGMLMLW